MGYIFGGNTGMTPEKIKRLREIARALGPKRAPRNVGEGIAALGEGLFSGLSELKANRGEDALNEQGSALWRDYFGGTAEAPADSSPATAASAVPSSDILAGIDPKLIGVMEKAKSYLPEGMSFQVGEHGGRRDEATQRQLMQQGRSKTMNSRHLHGTALDLIPIVNGRPIAEDNPGYGAINDAMMRASTELGVPLEWGGNWKSFVDKPHYQLAKTQNPATLPAGGSMTMPRGPVDSLAAPQQVAQALGGAQNGQRRPSGIDPGLLAIIKHPSFDLRNEGEKAVALSLLKRQMEASQPPDPMDALRQRKLEMEIQRMQRDPDLLSPEALQQKLQLRPQGTTVNVSTGENAFAKEFGKRNAETFFERRQGAIDAVASIKATQEARKLLDSGVITGAGAEWILATGKALQTIGFNVAEDPIANTEAFVATRAQEVGRIIKLFGAGTGLSDADREFATKAAAGKVTMNEKSIRRILDINEKASHNVVKLFNKDASQIDPKLSPYPLQVDLPDDPALPQGVPESPADSDNVDDLLKKYGQ